MLPESRDVELEAVHEQWDRMGKDLLSKIIFVIEGCYKVTPKRTRALLLAAALVAAALLGVAVLFTNNVTAFVLGVFAAILAYMIYLRLPRH